MNPILLDGDQLEFIRGSVSITLASCGLDGKPQLVRAIGCRVDAQEGLLTLFVPVPRAQQLLRDVAANGAVAVVFSRPATHRALQLKGRGAQTAPLAAGDAALVEAYRDAFVAEVGKLGFQEPLVRKLLHCPTEQLVALSFHPGEAYLQTPGPNAGKKLEAGQ